MSPLFNGPSSFIIHHSSPVWNTSDAALLISCREAHGQHFVPRNIFFTNAGRGDRTYARSPRTLAFSPILACTLYPVQAEESPTSFKKGVRTL